LPNRIAGTSAAQLDDRLLIEPSMALAVNPSNRLQGSVSTTAIQVPIDRDLELHEVVSVSQLKLDALWVVYYMNVHPLRLPGKVVSYIS